MASGLKPALIIGSGFHRYVFSADGAEPPHNRACLLSWDELINATANRMEVACPKTALNPTMRWEALISNASIGGYKTDAGKLRDAGKDQAHQIEAQARRHVVKALANASNDYPASTRARLPAQSIWGCVVSLNFDMSWHPLNNAIVKKRLEIISELSTGITSSSKEFRRLRTSLPPIDGAPRVWFPNGSVLEPQSIRMGLRDYGAVSSTVYHEFRRLKAWETQNFGSGGLRTEENFDKISGILDRMPEADEKMSGLPRSWVTELLYRPLFFAGVGLSEQESGLWWLLHQRARNLARIPEDTQYKVRILVRSDDRSDFWASQPCGIEPIVCDTWDRGWDDLLNFARDSTK